ncbi:MAG: Asp23/Gls24 family envelope stress response protein [Acidimicrobiales bacterium]|nr:Asp23/Gls24 family envelope stress response protein [Acidimicrobiales bacterium]
MSDFSTDNRPTSNGPASYPLRRDDAHGPGADPSPRHQSGVVHGPSGGGGGPAPVSGGGPASVSGGGSVSGAASAAAPTRPGTPPAGPQAGPPQHASPAEPGPAQRRAPEVKGRIHIADEVVEKVAALAAMEVDGVADLGGDIARAVESVRERIGIGNKRGDQGVKADVSGHEVTVNVTIMVEFGHVVMDVARQVQANVAAQTNRMLGLDVLEVNVTVDDVRTVPRAAEDDNSPAR